MLPHSLVLFLLETAWRGLGTGRGFLLTLYSLPLFLQFEGGAAHTQCNYWDQGDVVAQLWVKYSDLAVMSGVSITQRPCIPQRKIEEDTSECWGAEKINKAKINVRYLVQPYNGTAISWNILLPLLMFGRILKTFTIQSTLSGKKQESDCYK